METSHQHAWTHRPPALDIGTNKYGLLSPPLLESTSAAGSLTPDVQPNSPPVFPLQCPATTGLTSAMKIGNYLLTDRLTDMSPGVAVYKAIHVVTQQSYLCRILPLERCQSSLMPFSIAGPHPYISGIAEVLVGSTSAYAMHHTSVDSIEDLHAYVRRRCRLPESEAARLFAQALEAVAHCHRNGVVVRDIKLRRFAFADAERTLLQLDSLYDAIVFTGSDDSLNDKHGCLAYVSPEILDATFTGSASSATSETATVGASSTSTGRYSGRAADMWSLGVMLYTMLVGRYPFADTDACALFARIRRGRYPLPSEISLSASARCLIRSLLSVSPTDRLTSEEALRHPWFSAAAESESSNTMASFRGSEDHRVPEASLESTQDLFVE